MTLSALMFGSYGVWSRLIGGLCIALSWRLLSRTSLSCTRGEVRRAWFRTHRLHLVDLTGFEPVFTGVKTVGVNRYPYRPTKQSRFWIKQNPAIC